MFKFDEKILINLYISLKFVISCKLLLENFEF